MVVQTLTEMAAECRQQAVNWWTTQGVTIQPGESPWLVAVEKVNAPRDQAAAGTGQRFDPAEYAARSTLTARDVFAAVAATVGYDRVFWVCPTDADTRWHPECSVNGTGDPLAFYPAELLAGWAPQRRDRNALEVEADACGGQVKDLAAGWSIGADAASSYARRCTRTRGRLLPPSRALDVLTAARPGARDGAAPAPEPVVVYAAPEPPTPPAAAAAAAPVLQQVVIDDDPFTTSVPRLPTAA